MARDRRRSKLSQRELIAELDHDLLQANAAAGVSVALFHLREVVDTLAEARRRWLAAKTRGTKAMRVLKRLEIPGDRYGRQLARAVNQLRASLERALIP